MCRVGKYTMPYFSFFSGKEAELWSQQCVHLTGDIIYAQSCSETHLS